MNTLAKLAISLPAISLLGACTMMTPAPTTSKPMTTPTQTAPNLAYDRMAPTPYTCSNDSKIMAKQSINKTQANIIVTAFELNWLQQRIVLNGGVKGEVASYVNSSNPEAIYAWHMEDDKGVFAIKWADGQEYQLDCKIGK